MDSDKLFSVSVRGASHVKAGTPMQDYSLSAVGEKYSIAVVCDGHGASKHFRSDKGSEFATLAVKDKLLAFLDANPTWEKAQEDLSEKLVRLRLSILAEWQHRIEKYTKENPFTEEERKKASPSFAAREKYNLTQPYGTTLLAVLMTEEYVLLMMIGDGAIVRFFPDSKGEVIHFPEKAAYDDQPHSMTDSLCEPDAYAKLFMLAEPRKPKDGALYALCSDGISEAFVTDAYLLEQLRTYVDYRMEVGREQAETEIGENLYKLSQKTTEDDMSLAFASLEPQLYEKALEATIGGETPEEGKAEPQNTEPAPEVNEPEEAAPEEAKPEEAESEETEPEEAEPEAKKAEEGSESA